MLKLMLNARSKTFPGTAPAACEVYFTQDICVEDVKNFKRTDWLDLFFARCEEYYLEPARLLADRKHGFASIVLASSLIEYVVTVTDGNGSTTRTLIKNWITTNLPEYQEVAKEVYELFRCGLIHNGRIKTGGLCSFDVHGYWQRIHGAVTINPSNLVAALGKSLSRLRESCRTNGKVALQIADAMKAAHLGDLKNFSV